MAVHRDLVPCVSDVYFAAQSHIVPSSPLIKKPPVLCLSAMPAAVASAQLIFPGKPASSCQFKLPPSSELLRACRCVKETHQIAESVAFRVGQGIPNS